MSFHFSIGETLTARPVAPRAVPAASSSAADERIGATAGDRARDWREQARRYHGAERIDAGLVDWIETQRRWFEIERARPVYGLVRAVLDRVVAGAALIALAPLLALIAAAVRVTSSGPAFYTQLRVGRGCQVFRVIKFRTMVDGAERQVPFAANQMSNCMFKVEADPRITALGRFLRRWSLDELPQLVNVVLGDMALIGPRPLELEHAAAVPPSCADRFAALPGITGYWQATARDCKDGYVKVAMDAYYVRHRGPWLDLRLLLRTVTTLLSGRGAC